MVRGVPGSVPILFPFHHLLLKLLVCLMHILLMFSILIVARFLCIFWFLLIVILFQLLLVCHVGELDIIVGSVGSVEFFSMAGSVTLGLAASSSP